MQAETAETIARITADIDAQVAEQWARAAAAVAAEQAARDERDRVRAAAGGSPPPTRPPSSTGPRSRPSGTGCWPSVRPGPCRKGS